MLKGCHLPLDGLVVEAIFMPVFLIFLYLSLLSQFNYKF